jgi:hypothetical protein
MKQPSQVESMTSSRIRIPESVHYMIIGGGVAGGHAIFEIRRHDKSRSIEIPMYSWPWTRPLSSLLLVDEHGGLDGGARCMRQDASRGFNTAEGRCSALPIREGEDLTGPTSNSELCFFLFQIKRAQN